MMVILSSEPISSNPSQKSAKVSCRALSGKLGSNSSRRAYSRLLLPTRFSPTTTILPFSAASNLAKFRKFSIFIREIFNSSPYGCATWKIVIFHVSTLARFLPLSVSLSSNSLERRESTHSQIRPKVSPYLARHILPKVHFSFCTKLAQ